MTSPEAPIAIDEEAKRQQILEAEAQILDQSKRIEFYITEYSVELLANKMRDGEFWIPPYQREDTWDAHRKSRFIESILMGLPIPFLFFWESQDNGKLEIVDGSQRLRTIEQFILGGMKLVGDLTKLTSMQGLTFDDLPEARRRKIRNRSIRGIVLNEHADEEARFDLFERINTGSLMANKAEVRRGALSGPFLTLVIDLAKDPTLVQLAPISEAQVKLREREELVTRFFAYGDGLDGYQDRVSPFLFAYAKKMNEEFTKSPELVDEYRDRFHKTIGFISRVFPFGFRRTAKGKATPRSRFEAISVGVHRALSEKPDLEALNVDVKHWISGVAFQECVGSDGANAVARLKARIDFVRDKLVNQ